MADHKAKDSQKLIVISWKLTLCLDSLIRASAKLLNIHIALPALELNLMLLDSNCNNHCTRVGTVRCCKQHSNISYLKHQIFGFIIKIIIRKASGRVFDCWMLDQILTIKWAKTLLEMKWATWSEFFKATIYLMIAINFLFRLFFSKIKIMFCAFIIAILLLHTRILKASIPDISLLHKVSYNRA